MSNSINSPINSSSKGLSRLEQLKAKFEVTKNQELKGQRRELNDKLRFTLSYREERSRELDRHFSVMLSEFDSWKESRIGIEDREEFKVHLPDIQRRIRRSARRTNTKTTEKELNHKAKKEVISFMARLTLEKVFGCEFSAIQNGEELKRRIASGNYARAIKDSFIDSILKVKGKISILPKRITDTVKAINREAIIAKNKADAAIEVGDAALQP